ncbi:ABC transporter ATP-binding protein [Corynebacterium sp. 13CS0277]|nr:ABC transporter ATP-binding protein [Corynebacterium sp. 13CS0277]
MHALREVTFDVDRGTIVGLLGANGAGKSTMIDLILGLTTPTSGSIRVDGMSPTQAVRHGTISAVLQDGGLLPGVRVGQLLRLVAAAHPYPRDIDDVMRVAGIEDIAGRKVSTCSGGQQQRLRYALALLSRPDILLLDEPTVGMDARARTEFWEQMRAQAAAGTTILFATHYLKEVHDFASHIIVLDKGEVLTHTRTEEFLSAAADATVRATMPPDEAKRTPPQLYTSMRTTAGACTFRTGASDALARWLLTHTAAHDLTIDTASIEDAFLAWTGMTQQQLHAPDPSEGRTL